MGHSRDGAGETWQAADRQKDRLPAGVRIGAVLALAPAYNIMTEDMTAYEITKTPLAVVRGTCDGQVGREAFTFAADAATKSSAPAGRGRSAPGRCCLHRRLLPAVPRRRRAAVGRVGKHASRGACYLSIRAASTRWRWITTSCDSASRICGASAMPG